MKEIKIALCQQRFSVGNLEENYNKILKIREAQSLNDLLIGQIDIF